MPVFTYKDDPEKRLIHFYVDGDLRAIWAYKDKVKTVEQAFSRLKTLHGIIPLFQSGRRNQ